MDISIESADSATHARAKAELIDRPTIAEIDLGALRANYNALKAAVGGASVMAVVKADAYGHGAIAVARSLAEEGCGHFGVATIGEARELRAAGVAARIYLMAGFFADQADDIIALGLIPFISDISTIAPLGRAARAASIGRFPVHLKLDTGAARLGVQPADLARATSEFKRNVELEVEGVLSLFASAAEPASPITGLQLETFKRALSELKAVGIKPKYLHIANSAAAILRPDAAFNMVRIGLALYGLPPVPVVGELVPLRPVMAFKTRLMQLKQIPAGAGVSYGHTFIAARPTIVGILPVGYADGYRRGLQQGGEVLIRGRRAPVIGAVCMDLTMADLTDIPGVAAGDDAILWGGSGEAAISVNDVARLAHTISYEMLCTVGRRVRRVYIA